MGNDKIRYLATRRRTDGTIAYYWVPGPYIRKLGMNSEALGTDPIRARARALELNAHADELRNHVAQPLGPRPGTVARLFKEFRESDEFGELKPRTQKDYNYYMDKIEEEFGHLQVRVMKAKVIKAYVKRLNKEKGKAWRYHVLLTLRSVLSWAVGEEWIQINPALAIPNPMPPKRKVTWQLEQANDYVAKAKQLGWHSMAAFVTVMDCIAQSPIDVRSLLVKDYNGQAIDVTRAKTGEKGAPIPLWSEVQKELDEYLKTRPALHPDAPLFANEKTGIAWVESTMHKIHNKIRTKAGLPKQLQLQDFRRTAQTEAGAGGATVDEIRGLARHRTRSAGEHYVVPDARFVEAAQAKRKARREASARAPAVLDENTCSDSVREKSK